MKKLRRETYEDTKGFLRAVEALLEVLVLTGIYYMVGRKAYNLPDFVFAQTCGRMGLYGFLLWAFFRGTDCTLFGQLTREELAVGQVLSLCVVNAATYFQNCLIANALLEAVPMLALTVLEIPVAFVHIWLYTGLHHRLYAPHCMLLVYGDKRGVGLKRKMDARQDRYCIRGMISIDAGLAAITAEIAGYDAVVLADVPGELRNGILKYCYRYRVRAYVAPNLTDIMARGAKNITLFDTPLLLVKGSGLSPSQRAVKRLGDVLLSALALVAAAPVMAAAALAIKLEDGGPVLFRQKRLTRSGREFDILKFRSMIVDAEGTGGAVLASGNDPRITKVGRFLRASHLDELPQLVNILRGDMSIVGPRPERRELADRYRREIPEFDCRLKVRGGLTGYAQLYGKYNTSAYDKLCMDLMYIENYSLLLDIKLIVLTLRILLRRDSAEGIGIAQEQRRKAETLPGETEP